MVYVITQGCYLFGLLRALPFCLSQWLLVNCYFRKSFIIQRLLIQIIVMYFYSDINFLGAFDLRSQTDKRDLNEIYLDQ